MDQGQFTLSFLQTIILLGAAAVVVINMLDRRKTQRREVTLADTFATQRDLSRVEGQVHAVDLDVKNLRESIVKNGEIRRASIEAKVEASNEKLRDEMRAGNTHLHSRLDDLVVAVSKLQGRAELDKKV